MFTDVIWHIRLLCGITLGQILTRLCWLGWVSCGLASRPRIGINSHLTRKVATRKVATRKFLSIRSF